MDQEFLFFELKDSGNSLRLTVLKPSYPTSVEDWDKNYLDVKITANTGAFSGEFNTNFMTTDFENFKQQLRRLYDNLKGTANFGGYEHSDMIKVTGDGIGHLNAECKLLESSIPLNELTFELSFDQTYLPNIIDQLNQITREHPIIGDNSRITNEY